VTAARVLVLTSVLALVACGPRSDTEEARRAARALWEARDPGAFDAWRALPAGSPERALLARADARYRDGIERLETVQAGAQEALRDGVALAPMDPALYLRLARACRARGLGVRAQEYYLKYLRARPDAPDAARVRRELLALDPELGDVFAAEDEAARREVDERPRGLVPVAIAALVALAAVLLLVRELRRPRGVSLAALAAESPELHPSIAYLVSSLRHELLKHRIGAVGDAVRALAGGAATPAQREFLARRLGSMRSSGSLVDAWEGHLTAFERAFGARLDLRRADRSFRAAGKAIRALSALEPAVLSGRPGSAVRLQRTHAKLAAFDRELAALGDSLVRTTVDETLLRHVVDEVRSEVLAGRVPLDEVSVEPVPEGVEVEVFRFDLVTVLKNLVRNAVLAVDRTGAPRRVGLDVRVDLDETGLELVRLRVRDTSAEPVSLDAVRDRRPDRGLGLVSLALLRYDGALEVEPGEGGWAKGVTVRFFRALSETPGSI
jgi:hypothetical protein